MTTWNARQALGTVATVLWLTIPAASQPASAPPSTSPGEETGRKGLPVIGTIFEHRAELGLSASQVQALERLSLGLVREAIRRQADLMITHIDLDVLLDQDADETVDLAAAEAKFRDLEKIRTDLQVALVRAVEAARATLTAEQRAMLAPLLLTGGESRLDPADDPPGAVSPAGLAPSAGGASHRPAPGGGAPHPRPPDGRRPDGRREAGRHDGGRAVIRVWPSFWWEPYWFYAPPPIIVEPPVYPQAPQGYWYYCQSAQAYYPYVVTCPEPWIPVLPSPQ